MVTLVGAVNVRRYTSFRIRASSVCASLRWFVGAGQLPAFACGGVGADVDHEPVPGLFPDLNIFDLQTGPLGTPSIA